MIAVTITTRLTRGFKHLEAPEPQCAVYAGFGLRAACGNYCTGRGLVAAGVQD